MRIGNMFRGIPGEASREVVETLVSTARVVLERIVSKGQASPEGFWYDQEAPEWVLLLSGSAGLRFETEPEALTLSPGDYLLIPAHARHRVEWTDPGRETVWLALHFPP